MIQVVRFNKGGWEARFFDDMTEIPVVEGYG